MAVRDIVAVLMAQDAESGTLRLRSSYYRFLFGAEYDVNLRVVKECGGTEETLMDAYDREVLR